MVSAAIRLRALASFLPQNLSALAFREKQPVLGRVFVIGHPLDCASIQWMARCRSVPPATGLQVPVCDRHIRCIVDVRTINLRLARRWSRRQREIRMAAICHRRSHTKESNGPGRHYSLKIVHRGCTGNAHVIRPHENRNPDGVIRKGPHMGRFLDMVLSSAQAPNCVSTSV